MEENKKVYPEAICQFCQKPVEDPDSFWDLYPCNNCGAKYSMEFPEDIADILLNAEEDGEEARVLRNYDFSKENKDDPDEYGTWVHLVFRKKKEE